MTVLLDKWATIFLLVLLIIIMIIILGRTFLLDF